MFEELLAEPTGEKAELETLINEIAETMIEKLDNKSRVHHTPKIKRILVLLGNYQRRLDNHMMRALELELKIAKYEEAFISKQDHEKLQMSYYDLEIEYREQLNKLMIQNQEVCKALQDVTVERDKLISESKTKPRRVLHKPVKNVIVEDVGVKDVEQKYKESQRQCGELKDLIDSINRENSRLENKVADLETQLEKMVNVEGKIDKAVGTDNEESNMPSLILTTDKGKNDALCSELELKCKALEKKCGKLEESMVNFSVEKSKWQNKIDKLVAENSKLKIKIDELENVQEIMEDGKKIEELLLHAEVNADNLNLPNLLDDEVGKIIEDSFNGEFDANVNSAATYVNELKEMKAKLDEQIKENHKLMEEIKNKEIEYFNQLKQKDEDHFNDVSRILKDTKLKHLQKIKEKNEEYLNNIIETEGQYFENYKSKLLKELRENNFKRLQEITGLETKHLRELEALKFENGKLSLKIGELEKVKSKVCPLADEYDLDKFDCEMEFISLIIETSKTPRLISPLPSSPKKNALRNVNSKKAQLLYKRRKKKLNTTNKIRCRSLGLYTSDDDEVEKDTLYEKPQGSVDSGYVKSRSEDEDNFMFGSQKNNAAEEELDRKRKISSSSTSEENSKRRKVDFILDKLEKCPKLPICCVNQCDNYLAGFVGDYYVPFCIMQSEFINRNDNVLRSINNKSISNEQSLGGKSLLSAITLSPRSTSHAKNQIEPSPNVTLLDEECYEALRKDVSCSDLNFRINNANKVDGVEIRESTIDLQLTNSASSKDEDILNKSTVEKCITQVEINPVTSKQLFKTRLERMQRKMHLQRKHQSQQSQVDTLHLQNNHDDKSVYVGKKRIAHTPKNTTNSEPVANQTDNMQNKTSQSESLQYNSNNNNNHDNNNGDGKTVRFKRPNRTTRNLTMAVDSNKNTGTIGESSCDISISSNDIETVEISFDSPRSPSPELARRNKHKPKIIPVETILKEKEESRFCKIQKQQNNNVIVDVLGDLRGKLDLLYRFHNSTVVTKEVIKTFIGKPHEIIIAAIFRMLWKDKYDTARVVAAIDGPLLTPIQQLMVGFMMELEERGVHNLMGQFITSVEQAMFMVNNIEQLSPYAKVHVAICKQKYYFRRMRTLLCKVLAEMDDIAIPYTYMVLRSWPKLIPSCDFSKLNDYSAVEVRALINAIKLRHCNDDKFLGCLKNLIMFLCSGFHNYPSDKEDTNTILEELFTTYVKNGAPESINYLIQALCKTKDAKLVFNSINNLKLKLLSLKEINDMCLTIRLIGLIMCCSSKNNPSINIGSNKEFLTQYCEDTYPDSVRSAATEILNKLN